MSQQVCNLCYVRSNRKSYHLTKSSTSSIGMSTFPVEEEWHSLNSISSVVGVGSLGEPWRTVKLAARTGGTTPSTLPKTVSREELLSWDDIIIIPSLTEVVSPYVCWCSGDTTITRTEIGEKVQDIRLSQPSSKCPDVPSLSRSTVRQTHSIHIALLETAIRHHMLVEGSVPY